MGNRRERQWDLGKRVKDRKRQEQTTGLVKKVYNKNGRCVCWTSIKCDKIKDSLEKDMRSAQVSGKCDA